MSASQNGGWGKAFNGAVSNGAAPNATAPSSHPSNGRAPAGRAANNLPQTVFQPAPASPYMPQLDGLRAIAVLVVMLHHFLPHVPDVMEIVGPMGVRVFFVLSGFLITGILLNCRDRAELSGSPPLGALKPFYIRRTLRIFPLYYFVILTGAIAGISGVTYGLGWHLTYTSNLWLAFVMKRWPEGVSHLWSLAVAEQFYALWPALMLLAPRHLLLPLIGTAIITGPLYRLMAVLLHWPNLALVTPLPACLDTLGIGALLAYARHYRDDHPSLEENLRRMGIGIAGWVLLVILAQEWRGVDVGLLNPVFRETAMAGFGVWAVGAAADGMGGRFGWFLEQRPLLAVGKISYGLYLWHPLAMMATPGVLARLGLKHVTWGGGGYVVALFAVTFFFATLSWHLLEKPINNYKNLFSYAGRGAKGRIKRRSKAERQVSYPAPQGRTERRAALDRRIVADRRARAERRSRRGTRAGSGGLFSRPSRLVAEKRLRSDRRLSLTRRQDADRRGGPTATTAEGPGLETVWGQ